MGRFSGPLAKPTKKLLKAGAGKLADRLRGRVEPPLPVERWVQAPGLVFGLPSGWLDIPEQALLDAALRHPQRLRALAGVQADRSDVTYRPWHTILVLPTWLNLTETQFRSNVTGIGYRYAEDNAPAQVVAGPERLTVGGAPALRLKTEEVMDGSQYGLEHAVLAATTVVLACHRGRTYSIELCGPADQHEAYEAAFNTVLGTWRWG
jgi:hypothetical protein